MLAVRQRFQPVLGLVRWLTVPMLLLLSLGGCAKSPDETADLSDVPAGSHSHELPGDALVSTAEISARQAKQREALNQMGVNHVVRPDGSIVVFESDLTSGKSKEVRFVING